MPEHRTSLERACAHCGGPIPLGSPRSRRRFCSSRCVGQAARRETTARCERCGRPLSSGTGKRFKAEGRFCGMRCEQGAPEDRFWRRVDRSDAHGGCWRWTGGLNQRHLGYGRMRWFGRDRLAHHIAWMLTRGEIPAGQVVRHRCPGGGNDRCVNPEHLALGTQADNVRDMLEQGRHWSRTGTWSPPKGIRLKPPHCPTCHC